jgi:hypothetical protein
MVVCLPSHQFGSYKKRDMCGSSFKNIQPKYQVGEILYLKEPYRVHNCIYSYLAQDGKNICFAYTSMCNIDSCTVNLEFKTKKDMPQCYAQHFIEITNVRCERLQNISYEDCIKEGIQEQRWIDGADRDIFYVVRDMSCELYNTPQLAYAALIDKISGKGTWESNPYVWVYDFKLLKNK